MVGKGKIIEVLGPEDRCKDKTMATVEPYDQPGEVTPRLVIPWYYRGPGGAIKSGDEVVYVVFDDQTGMVLSRMDGNWTGKISGDVELLIEADGVKSSLKCKNIDTYEGVIELHNEETEGHIKVDKGYLELTKGDATLKEGDFVMKKGNQTLSDGNITLANGDVSTQVVASLNSHVHGGVQGGPGVTGGPQ